MFTCDCHKSLLQTVSVAAHAGQVVLSISVLCWCFLIMSDPPTKWNSSISFLSRYKAESESSLLGALVTEGKCIKEVKHLNGWSAAKAPLSPRPCPATKKLLSVKKHQSVVCICPEVSQHCMSNTLRREAGLWGHEEDGSTALTCKVLVPKSGCGKRCHKKSFSHLKPVLVDV